MAHLLTAPQCKRLADTVNALGLAAVIGGVGDAVVNGTRQSADRLGIASGAILLVLSIWLSRWETDETAHDTRLTRSVRRR